MRVLIAVTLLTSVVKAEEDFVMVQVFKGDYDGPCRMLLWVDGEPVRSNSSDLRSIEIPLWKSEHTLRLELDQMMQEYPVTSLDLHVRWFSFTEYEDPSANEAKEGGEDKAEDPEPIYQEQGIKLPENGVIERNIKVKVGKLREDALKPMQVLKPEDLEGVKQAFLGFVRAVSEREFKAYQKHFLNKEEIKMDQASENLLFAEGKEISFAGRKEVEVVMGKKVALVRLQQKQMHGEDPLMWSIMKLEGERGGMSIESLRVSKRADGKWVVWSTAWKPMVLKELAGKKVMEDPRPVIVGKVLGQIGQLKQGDGWDDFCKAAGLDRKDLEAVKGAGAHGVDTFLYRFVEHDGWLLQVLYKTPKEGQKDELLRIGVIRSDVEQARKAWPNLKLSIYPYYQNGKVVKEEQN